MSPQAILSTLSAHHVSVRLAPDGQNLVVPKAQLTPELRSLIVDHKPDLVEFLRAARATAAEVVDAAMLACDYWGDRPAAREQMRRDVEATPEHLRADLLEHFRAAYPRKAAP